MMIRGSDVIIKESRMCDDEARVGCEIYETRVGCDNTKRVGYVMMKRGSIGCCYNGIRLGMMTGKRLGCDI